MKYLKTAKERSATTTPELRGGVTDIIEDVQANGDEALFRYSSRFDGCERRQLRVTQQELEAALAALPEEDVADLRAAAKAIESFARAQLDTMADLPAFSPSPGVTLGHRVIPVDSCLCYVPGGNYPLYSTALMLAIPAKVAGVKRVCAASPAVKGTDSIHPRTLAAMAVAGVDEVYVVGGAQAIAAFSYGTGQIAPVDMIVGPGNSYVTEAKRQCYGQVGLDFLAGPSEVLIIADERADASLIAIDLLAQSEHDAVAKGILVTTSEALANRVTAEVEGWLSRLETADIARHAWEDYGEVILADSLKEAAALTNEIAPEHLEVQTEDPDALAEKLHNYGSLFLGACTAEVFGDYASGTNHTLPTLRAPRYTGGVWVGTFLKTCTHQGLTPAAAVDLAPLVARMARGEGLEAHALAADARLEKFGGSWVSAD